MAEIDQFQQSANSEQQSEYLKSINQSMTRLVDVTERTSNNSSNQFFQGNAVQSTVTSLREISQGAYSRFEDDLVTTRETARSASQRFSDAGSTLTGTAREFSSHVPEISPLAPIRDVGFFGGATAYSTNYRSTFWNDLNAGYLGERAPQTMFQSDFTQLGRENLSMRWRALSPMRATASLMGIDLGIDNENVDAVMAMSQRYTRFGTSTAMTGVGSRRGEVISMVEGERMRLLDQLGYNQDDFNATRQIFAAGGQFIGTKNEIERSNVTFQGMGQAEQIAKVLAVPIQEAARAMMDVRGQLGITSLAGQSNFIMQTQALGMASGLSFQETMGGALAGAGLARNLGFNVRAGGTLGRDILASVNGAYLDRAISENLIQSAGGVQNLSSNLANSALSFATGPGSLYYLASMQGGQFNQNAFNEATGGFNQLGLQAAGQASTVQGYANFMSNRDSIQAQGGSHNVMAMQRAHLNNIFKSATGRDYSSASSDDKNMMTMLAGSSGIFSDPTTAKAFVTMNFTEDGVDSMYATQRDAYKAEKNLKFKAALDERYKGNSTDALARTISNVWNKPAQGLRGWFNDTFDDFGGRRKLERDFMWSTGQMPLGKLTSEDVSEFGSEGGFSRDITSGPITGNAVPPIGDPSIFARTAVGAWEGGNVGFKAAGAISTGAIALGLGMAAVGGLMSLTGIGAVPGAALMGFGGKTALWGITGGLAVGAGITGAGILGGGLYGATNTTSPYMVPGLDVLNKDPAAMRVHDATAKAWNRAGGFSQAEKNAMMEPDTQKAVIKKLMDKGLGATTKITSDNQVAVNEMIRSAASELGMSEEMVANIAKTKGGLSGDMLYGSELAWAQTGGLNMSAMGDQIKDDLKGTFGKGFVGDELINDSDFTSKLGNLLSKSDSAERKMAGVKFLGAFGESMSEEGRKTLDRFISTGTLANRENLSGELLQRAANLRSLKVKDNIQSMFGSRAKEEKDVDIADRFNEIANAGSPSSQVGLVLANLNDDKFREAISKDPSLKRLLPLEGRIDKSMLADEESFKSRFKFSPMDDLKELQTLFDKGGESDVRNRIAGGLISASAKGDTSSGKVNESQLLNDAASTIKDAANILKGMK